MKLVKEVTSPHGDVSRRTCEFPRPEESPVGRMFVGQGAAQKVVVYEQSGYTVSYELEPVENEKEEQQ